LLTLSRDAPTRLESSCCRSRNSLRFAVGPRGASILRSGVSRRPGTLVRYQILLANHRILAKTLKRFRWPRLHHSQDTPVGGGGDQMLHSRSKISANRSIKLAVAAAAMALLAGCAVTMPLRPLATFSQCGRALDFACRTGAKCSNGTTDHRVSYRRSQLIGGSKIDDDPPDFIGDQDSTPPIRTQNE
jgi:hypothetical protein